MASKVPYINLAIQHQALNDELLEEISGVISSGQFILGDQVSDFEKSFAAMHDCKYAVGVANGTDALVLALKAINIKHGDEVITCPNSYLASASSVVLAGGVPVFCDVDDDMNMNPESLRKSITERTKAIIPVHLTGKPAAMDEILAIAKEYNLSVVEDAAQAVGASLNGKGVGSFGNVGCFSLHPLKNLSACGDAGIITTNDEEIYNYLITARNHGLVSRDACDFFSLNSRLDSLQAAILNVKIKHIEQWNERRRKIAAKYNQAFSSYVRVPTIGEKEYAVFHTYIIQTDKRDALQKYLSDHDVDSKVHYPIPIHEQTAWKKMFPNHISYPETEKQSQEILSLPVYPELTDEQVDRVIQVVLQFFKS